MTTNKIDSNNKKENLSNSFTWMRLIVVPADNGDILGFLLFLRLKDCKTTKKKNIYKEPLVFWKTFESDLEQYDCQIRFCNSHAHFRNWSMRFEHYDYKIIIS